MKKKIYLLIIVAIATFSFFLCYNMQETIDSQRRVVALYEEKSRIADSMLNDAVAADIWDQPLCEYDSISNLLNYYK